jgi:hypothetical protein
MNILQKNTIISKSIYLDSTQWESLNQANYLSVRMKKHNHHTSPKCLQETYLTVCHILSLFKGFKLICYYRSCSSTLSMAWLACTSKEKHVQWPNQQGVSIMVTVLKHRGSTSLYNNIPPLYSWEWSFKSRLLDAPSNELAAHRL